MGRTECPGKGFKLGTNIKDMKTTKIELYDVTIEVQGDLDDNELYIDGIFIGGVDVHELIQNGDGKIYDQIYQIAEQQLIENSYDIPTILDI